MAKPSSTTERPLYRAIADQLVADIRKGTYRSGDRLPGFVELAHRFNVSHITSNHALNELAQAGYVKRISRKGTFVCPRPSGITSILIPMNLQDYSECSHLTEYLYGVFSRAREKGITVRLEPIDSDIFHSAGRLRQSGADAVIQLGDPQYDFPYRQIKESGILWIGVGVQEGPCPYYVCEDYRQGTRLLIERMSARVGKRIGIVVDPSHKNHQLCMQGFLDAMGDTVKAQRLVCQADHTSIDQVVTALCRTGNLDGIVVCGVMCVRAVEALRAEGCTIPAGFLAETKAVRTLEGMSFVVRLDHIETGRHAVDFLDEACDGKTPVSSIVRVPPFVPDETG